MTSRFPFGVLFLCAVIALLGGNTSCKKSIETQIIRDTVNVQDTIIVQPSRVEKYYGTVYGEYGMGGGLSHPYHDGELRYYGQDSVIFHIGPEQDYLYTIHGDLSDKSVVASWQRSAPDSLMVSGNKSAGQSSYTFRYRAVLIR